MSGAVTTQQIEAVEKAVHDFREANEQALAEKADKGYVSAQVQERVDALNAQIDAKLEAVQTRVDGVERAGQVAGLYGSDAEPASKHQVEGIRQFRAATSMIQGVGITEQQAKLYNPGFDAWMRNGEISADMSVGSNPDGGYLVSPDTTGRMVMKSYETSPMRQLANVQSITADALEGALDEGEGDAGWVSERGTRGTTNTPEVGRWRIPVHELYAQPRLTQKLLQDAGIDVAAWMAEKTGSKFSRVENAAFVTGDGSGKPRGFLSRTVSTDDDDSRAAGVVRYFPTGAAGAFAGSNPGDVLIDALYSLKDAYAQNALWVMRRSTEAEVRKLKDGDGNYLWQPDFQQRGATSLLGHGIRRLEDMPAIAADAFSIAVGDWREAYQIVDRLGITVLRDPYTQKPWVLFYTTKRVGGDAVNFEAYRIVKFAAS